MYATLTCLQAHDLRLVLLAAVICIVACACALSAYRRAVLTSGAFRNAWAALVACLLGCGVWATHFVAILAFQRQLRLGFELAGTALSLLCAIGGLGLGVWIAARRPTLTSRLIAGAIWGLAIAAMHFMGVSAMRLPAVIQWDYGLATAAVVIGMLFGAASLAVAGDLSRPWRGVAATMLLALAICGLHFTAMGAVTLIPAPMVEGPTVYGRQPLAAAVSALVVLILSGGGGMLAIDRLSKAAALEALHSALDRAPTALGFFDRDRRLMFWNEAYAAWLGLYGLRAETGAAFPDLVRGAAEAGLPAAIAGAALEMRIDDDLRLNDLKAPNGRWYDVDVAPSGDGGFVVIVADVTAHREMAEREAKARAAAEQANAAKTDFLANMSHEIRTPLNAVLGMAQIMERDALDPIQRERLEVIGSSGRALLSTLNDVLDLAKIEAGKIEVESHRFELEETVRLAAAPYAQLARQKDVGFRIELAPETAGSWLGDSGRLRQVLTNLLSNAVKFTEAGEIVLRVARGEDAVRFSISDTGVGIAADKLEAIFDKFTQADTSTTRRFGGTGLGLAICDEFVRLMGGRLGVESVEGAGSTFAFALPLARAQAPPPEAIADSASRPKGALRILAAEDNPTNQLILSALLQPLDVELTLVRDGSEAVEAFAAAAYDLVLMDVQMPRMSGTEAAQAIRRREAARSGPRTPIIALTANVMRHQLEEYAQAGIDGCVGKPLEAAKLYQAIETALAAADSAQAA
jgi:signal transduction histidine kinase/NO-binding membrane sensor protein with MHYT domain/BarA-like signal transduction histidine kinase